ncbi:putative E3 ubiquitin-protein ligase UBR7 [Atheta coriaria]|uniref:putative E3 ubiquitin-protein ligase UBR7 n=1 Tax=Dalotia coriaria TaxID=877792 RepID=UPI0031F36C58
MADENKVNEASSSQPQPGEDEEVIQLGDLLKHQEETEEEVAAVLGAGDEVNCSYDQGYMKRQALYACLTCIPEAKDDLAKTAGFCLACSYHCHDGHNLVELYTKRHFRCDCGNKKFGDMVCNLHTAKDDFNTENLYNQNFTGLYCTCHKPYPDPEDPIEDDMIQCVICEDWYHSRHLNAAAVVDFAEMICQVCVAAHEFLMSYAGLAVIKVEHAKVDEQVNVTTDNENDKKQINGNHEVKSVENGEEKEKESTGDDKNIPTSDESVKDKENADETAKTEDVTSTTPKIDEVTTVTDEKVEKNHEIQPETMETSDPNCTKPIVKEESQPRTLFMKELKWRNNLCKCDACLALYKQHNVEYLLDMEDTVEFYENKGKERLQDAKKRAIEAEQNMLKSMPRAPLLNAIAGFNDFKEQLSDYLKQFAEEKKVLTVDDVKQFFSKLNSNKRQKTSETTYFCR